MKILKRLRPLRPIKTVVAAMLGVLSVAGATLTFAGSAGAALTTTPLNANGASAIIMIPGGFQTALALDTANQPAESWAFQLSDTGTVSGGVTSQTWKSGDSINIPVFLPVPAGTAPALNNTNTGDWVSYGSALPTYLCTGGGSGVTQPAITISESTNPHDNTATKAAGLKDVLSLTFTNSPTVGSATPFDCVILGITYSVGPLPNPIAQTQQGELTYGEYITTVDDVQIADPGTTDNATYEQGSAPSGTSPVGGDPTTHESALDTQANAVIQEAILTANNPPVSVEPNAIDAPISNIVGSETLPKELPVGYICVVANSGDFVVTSTSPTVTESPSGVGGVATISGSVAGEDEQANGGYNILAIQVLHHSTTVATTFTLSGLNVNAPAGVGPVDVTIVVGASSNCAGGTEITDDLQIYAVGVATGNTRIAGSTAEQTAEAALEYQYNPTPGFCLPQGVHPDPSRFSTGSTVILATSGSWQDALTASYLASFYDTGVLLTPTGSLSPYAAQAIQQEGVSNVIIVGGTLAVSQAVQNQLAATPSYQCGGGSPQLNALGSPIDLEVQRVAGQTADATAEAVATYVDSGYVGLLNISGAFGQYNDTLGTDSGSSQTVPVRTAILVTDDFFQDAASASAMSYYEQLPILLTPQASLGTNAETGLLDLGIQQVIELGGPLAISDTVNSSLESQGIAVLRIAGADGSETSVQLAKFELNHAAPNDGLDWAHDNGGGASSVIGLARGDYFADALTSSVVTGGGEFGANSHRPFPIILAENPNNLGTYATAFFNSAGNGFGIDPFYTTPLTPNPGSGVTVRSITVFGGPLAIAQATLQAALTAISAG